MRFWSERDILLTNCAWLWPVLAVEGKGAARGEATEESSGKLTTRCGNARRARILQAIGQRWFHPNHLVWSILHHMSLLGSLCHEYMSTLYSTTTIVVSDYYAVFDRILARSLFEYQCLLSDRYCFLGPRLKPQISCTGQCSLWDITLRTPRKHCPWIFIVPIGLYMVAMSTEIAQVRSPAVYNRRRLNWLVDGRVGVNKPWLIDDYNGRVAHENVFARPVGLVSYRRSAHPLRTSSAPTIYLCSLSRTYYTNTTRPYPLVLLFSWLLVYLIYSNSLTLDGEP